MAPRKDKEEGKELEVKGQAGALAVVDLEEDSGAGMENVDRECFAIPFLTILQSGSPQCKRSEGKYIQGAMEGMLFNTVTQEVIDTEKVKLLFQPCYFARRIVEWIPKDDGGGYCGDYTPGTEPASEKDEDGNAMMPNGHTLVDTRYHYGNLVNVEAGTTEMVVIAMAKTQLKKSKAMLTVLDGIRLAGKSGNKFCPPTFYSTLVVTTVPESNDKGSWFGWKFEKEGNALEYPGLYESGKHLNKLIMDGGAKAAEPMSDVAGDEI